MPSVTLLDVAREVGVHPSTVSRALDPAKAALVSPETRSRVEAAAKAMGYRGDIVAMGLRRRRTRTIGVVVADLGNPYIAPVIRGIENALEGRGIMPLIAESQDDRGRLNRLLDHLLSRKVDAIITSAARHGDDLALKKAAREVPVVLAVRTLPRSGLAAVRNDDRLGGELAARHLVDLGHERVAELRGPQDIVSFVDRSDGFTTHVRLEGVDVLELDAAATTPTLAEGGRLMRLLLDQHGAPPSAIFAHNDLMALGALDVLKGAGFGCPGDVSMVGYNDAPLVDRMDPPLTTLRIPGYDLGRFAAERAVTMIEQPEARYAVLSLPPELVVRGSTAAAARGRRRHSAAARAGRG